MKRLRQVQAQRVFSLVFRTYTYAISDAVGARPRRQLRLKDPAESGI